jgi:NOL1/NOP2/sun family putative RNA methylase
MPNLPAPFLRRLEEIYGEADREKVLSGLSVERMTSFRVNTLLADPKALVDSLARQGLTPQPIDLLPDAYAIAIDQRRTLTESQAMAEGQIYIQNPSSMLPPLILGPQPGEKILDLCAAPGSKTLQMAAMMHNEGWISAVEAVKNRFFRMKANLKKNGATMVHTYHRDGIRVWRYVPEEFDRVLLDAPCSSEGQFTLADERTYRYWSERKIIEMARKQKKLLFSAFHCLKPGGTLVYSTCTLAPEENEAVVDWLVKKFPNQVDILDIPLGRNLLQPALASFRGKPFDKEMRKAARILPDHMMEGFFVCLMRKRH